MHISFEIPLGFPFLDLKGRKLVLTWSGGYLLIFGKVRTLRGQFFFTSWMLVWVFHLLGILHYFICKVLLLLPLLLWLMDQIIKKIGGRILLETQGLITFGRPWKLTLLRTLACLLNYVWIFDRDWPTHHLYKQILLSRLHFWTRLFALAGCSRHTTHWLINKASFVLQNWIIFSFALRLESDGWGKFVVFVVCNATSFGAIARNISSCRAWTLVSISNQHQLRSLGE